MIPVLLLSPHGIRHVKMRIIVVACIGINIRYVPVAVQLHQIPGMPLLRVVLHHTLNVQHLHEHAEGGCISNANGVVILQYTVWIVTILLCTWNNRKRTAVLLQGSCHPVIYRLFLLEVSHVIRNIHFLKRGRCHV